jgi:predicted ArsR family transcriptional regulator
MGRREWSVDQKMNITEKEKKLLAFMNEYSVGSTKDVADDMGWSVKGTAKVLSNLRKKGLVRSYAMKYFPASTWKLTEDGEKQAGEIE